MAKLGGFSKQGKRKLKEVKAWSLSALNLFEQCPLKFYKERREGIKAPPSYALEAGIDQHNKLEAFLKGEIKGMPPVLQEFGTEIRNAKKAGAIAEEKISFDKSWEIIGHDDDAWWHEDVWGRAKNDIRIDNFLVDWKSGKHYDHYIEQAELLAILFFIEYPNYKTATVEFWYGKTGDVVTYEFKRNILNRVKKDFTARANKMLNAKVYEPIKNQYCKYCHVNEECPIYNG